MLYIVGGTGGIRFREMGTDRWDINGDGHFVPRNDSQLDIGTNTLRVANGYFDTLYGDGSNLTGIDSGVTSDSNHNTLGGTNAGGNFNTSGDMPTGNTLFGKNAGDELTNHDYSTAIGYDALKSGSYNTAVGYQALMNNTGNTGNTAIGVQALRSCTTGSAMVAVGYGALYSTTSGAEMNVAVGNGAMQSLTTGDFSVALGNSANYGSTTSSNNTAIGYQSLFVSNSGNNTALGYWAGRSVSGTDNTLIGAQSGMSGSNNLTSGSNNTLIGHDAAASSATVSNEVTIGDTNITKFRIPGINVTLKDNGGTTTQGHVLTVDGNGEAGFAASSSPLSFRNKLYNGDMRIAQRGDAHQNVGNNASTYTLDRWKLYVQNTPARFQIERNYDHSLPDGFNTSMRISCTTADTSLAALDEVYLVQVLEGNDVYEFAKGTTSAKQYTLSFWAKSDKTGTYIVRLLGRDNTTSCCSASYTVSNTWTRHVITFPADTNSNRKDNPDNGEALRVMWYLVAGSGIDNGTLQTTWVNSTDTGAATGQVNFADNNSNRDFYITGCQLEAGPVATPFEYVPYPQQLSRCKRYFQKFSAYGDHHHFGVARAESNTARTGIVVPVPMRSSPTVACNGHRTFRGDGGYNSESTSTPSVVSGWDSDSNIYTIDFGGHSLNHNQMYCLMSKTTSTNALTLDSEF